MPIVNGQIISASDYIDTSAGAGDSGKVPKLNSNGVLDESFLQVKRRVLHFINKTFGGSTTQFDITNPSGNTFRYTWDSTGTNPIITSIFVPIGTVLNINAQNFDASNNGILIVTGVGADYFEVTNASGVVESNKTIGTGSITGHNTWTKYDFLKEIYVEGWGSGGSGGTYVSTDLEMGGGGGGAYKSKIIYAQDLGSIETVTVALGGASIVSGGNAVGNAGADSTFGSHLTADGAYAPPNKNEGGRGGYCGFDSGSGGDSSTAPSNAYFGGGGGGSADNSGNARGGASSIYGGGGGGATGNFSPSTGGGNSVYAGSGGASGQPTGSAGGFPAGGGGAGGVDNTTGTATSGKGGDGLIRVTEYYN
jgi:hypothetical protein